MNGMIRVLFTLVGTMIAASAFPQVLQWEGRSLHHYYSGTPNNPWIVVQATTAYSYQILDTNYQEVTSFSLPIPGGVTDTRVDGASHDFDTDTNIEILYTYRDTTFPYNSSSFLRDIATGTNQLTFSHPDTNYFAGTLYFGNERMIYVIGYASGDWENRRSWLYRSDNPQGIAAWKTPEHDASLFLTSHPNPAHRTTRLEYSIPVSGAVQAAIYDASGRKLKILAEEHQRAGRYHLIWDGTDQAGRPLPSGSYYCLVKVDTKTITRKMILLR